MDSVRACLSAAIAALLVGAALVLGGPSTPPQPVAAPAPQPVAAAVPAPTVTSLPATSPTTTARSTTRPTTTRPQRRATTTTSTVDDVIADRCTSRIDYALDPRSNAELNAIGVLTGRCPTPITARTATENPGEAALDACTEQTGMTRDECRADAAAGNAN